MQLPPGLIHYVANGVIYQSRHAFIWPMAFSFHPCLLVQWLFFFFSISMPQSYSCCVCNTTAVLGGRAASMTFDWQWGKLTSSSGFTNPQPSLRIEIEMRKKKSMLNTPFVLSGNNSYKNGVRRKKMGGYGLWIWRVNIWQVLIRRLLTLIGAFIFYVFCFLFIYHGIKPYRGEGFPS